MFELFVVSGLGLITFRHLKVRSQELSPIPRAISSKVGKLWDIAHQGMRENSFLRAEKALLSILKIDQKNAAAYNRLGILYAKQKEYKDAVDCFEIASSIEPTASSLHNLGLIYFETENYPKAATAFEEALKIEDGLAARHVAYAKVQEKLKNSKLTIDHLEIAARLEPTRETLALLVNSYRDAGKLEKADQLEDRLKKKFSSVGRPKAIKRPKRVVV